MKPTYRVFTWDYQRGAWDFLFGGLTGRDAVEMVHRLEEALRGRGCSILVERE